MVRFSLESQQVYGGTPYSNPEDHPSEGSPPAGPFICGYCQEIEVEEECGICPECRKDIEEVQQ